MIFLLLYTATFVPIRTAFIDDVTPLFAAFEYTVDGCFIFDLFVNFLSAYVDRDKNLEIRLKKIAFTYV